MLTSMTATCDQCGETHTRQTTIVGATLSEWEGGSWIVLSRPLFTGERGGSLTFCSWLCLSRYAAKEVRRLAVGKAQTTKQARGQKP